MQTRARLTRKKAFHAVSGGTAKVSHATRSSSPAPTFQRRQHTRKAFRRLRWMVLGARLTRLCGPQIRYMAPPTDSVQLAVVMVRHVQQVRQAIVQGVFVVVMTNFAGRCLSNKPVHRAAGLRPVHSTIRVSIPAKMPQDSNPLAFRHNLRGRPVHDCKQAS